MPVTTVQQIKEDVSDMGLIKVDLLGLGMMAVLKYRTNLIPQHYGKNVTSRRYRTTTGRCTPRSAKPTPSDCFRSSRGRRWPRSGTRLIAPACHDTASAVAAVPDEGEDWAYISSGTWSLVGTALTKPLNTPAAQSANFANLRGAGGTVCFHKSMNGMWLMRQCIEAWKADGFEFTYSELLESVEQTPRPPFVLDIDEPELLLPGDMPNVSMPNFTGGVSRNWI